MWNSECAMRKWNISRSEFSIPHSEFLISYATTIEYFGYLLDA
jgi:hypothetical protein